MKCTIYNSVLHGCNLVPEVSVLRQSRDVLLKGISLVYSSWSPGNLGRSQSPSHTASYKSPSQLGLQSLVYIAAVL